MLMPGAATGRSAKDEQLKTDFRFGELMKTMNLL
jgi:hypothetical protein